MGFDRAEEHGRGDGRNWNAARFRAALSVEDVLLVAGGENMRERGLGRADDGDAADQLVRTAIDVDAIDDERNDLEGLR